MSVGRRESPLRRELSLVAVAVVLVGAAVVTVLVPALVEDRAEDEGPESAASPAALAPGPAPEAADPGAAAAGPRPSAPTQ